MRNIVNEDGEIIAKATKDGTLVGGHHRSCGGQPQSKTVLARYRRTCEA